MKTYYLPILLSIFIAGCDLAKPQGHKESTDTPNAAEVAAVVLEPEAPIAVAEEEKKEEQVKEPETEIVKADVGAGKKGHYGQTNGEQASDIITVPVATLFRAKEMTAFRIQVPQALQLYKAMNDNKGPETHEDFMKDIIQANNIPLPELPDGHEYIYDPATEQLMIKKPK